MKIRRSLSLLIVVHALITPLRAAQPTFKWIEVDGVKKTSDTGNFTVKTDQDIWVKIRFENNYGTALIGGITTSLSSFKGDILEWDFDAFYKNKPTECKLFPVGSKVYNRYGTLITTTKPIIESYEGWWYSGALEDENQTLKFKLNTGSDSDIFYIYTRAWLTDDNWKTISNNPGYNTTDYQDQQLYWCFRYKVTVRKPDTPNATRSSPSSPKTVQKGDRIKFTVRGQDDDGDLDYVNWWYDSGTKNRDEMSGDDDTDSHSFTFNTVGTHYIHADVYDAGARHDETKWKVYVNGSPTAPTGIWVDRETESSATLHWSASSDNDSLNDTISYQIQYGKDGVIDGWNPSAPLSTSGTEIKISDLDSLTTYDIRIKAKDSNGGDSGWNKVDKAFTTLNAKPRASAKSPETPKTIDVNTSQKFVVEAWDDDDGLDYVRWYVNGVHEGSTGEGIDFEGSYGDSSWTRSFTETGTYKVEAWAYDDGGNVGKATWNITAAIPIGDISATLKNHSGASVPSVDTRFLIYSFEPDKVATGNPGIFTDLPAGNTYDVEAQYRGPLPDRDWEYWGTETSPSVLKDGTVNVPIARETPYAQELRFYQVGNGGSQIPNGSNIDPTIVSSVYPAVPVFNGDDRDVSCFVELWYRKGVSGAETKIQSTRTTIPKGTSKLIGLPSIDISDGSYYCRLKVKSTYNGDVYTDTWPWDSSPRFTVVVNKPEITAMSITDLDRNGLASGAKLEPGKRYIATATFTDDDGRDDLNECWIRLKNTQDSSKMIELGYDPQNNQKKVFTPNQGQYQELDGPPAQNDYVCLTHVEPTPKTDGYEVRFIFWLTAKWNESTSQGITVHGYAKDESGNEGTKTLAQDFNFEPLSLEAGKWTIIVHGKSSSPENNVGDDLPFVSFDDDWIIPFGFGPQSWQYNYGETPSEWFDAKSTPAIGGRLDEGWAFRLAQKLARVSKVPVKIHRLRNRETFNLETWNNPLDESAGYKPYSGGDSCHNILLFEWDDPSDYVDINDSDHWKDNWYAYATSDALYALAKKQGFEDKLNTVIGYSRGAVVASDFTRRVLRDGHQNFQTIFLDAEGWGEFKDEVRGFPIFYNEITGPWTAATLLVVDPTKSGSYDIYEGWTPYSKATMALALWDSSFDSAQELEYYKYLEGFGYADYKFFAWKGTRSDQYREAYSNPGKAFCGAESLIGGGNDRTVEYWPKYSTVTNYIPSDKLFKGGLDASKGELSHSYFPHYFADWCYLDQDASINGGIAVETPQLWKWQDKDGVQQVCPSAAHPWPQIPTKIPTKPENMLGGVFNGSFRDGSAAGWTYHGGTTPFNGEMIYKDEDNNYWADLDSIDYPDISHNWMIVPSGVRGVRFTLDSWQIYGGFFQSSKVGVEWIGKTVPQDIGWIDPRLFSEPTEISFNFYTQDDVGRLLIWADSINGEVYIDDVQFISLAPPSINTFSVTPSSVKQGDVLTFVAGGVSAGDASVSTVDFYWDKNANGQLDAGEEKMATAYGSGSTWQATASSANLDLGDGRFIAIATDSEGLSSAPIGSNKVTVQQPINLLPEIGSLDCAGSVDRGDNLALTATGINDPDGSIDRVVFYYDENRNGVLDIGGGDRKLATDYSGGSTSSANVDTGTLSAGTAMFFAIAYDNLDARSGEVSCRSAIVQKWLLSYGSPVGGMIQQNPTAGEYPDGTKVQPTVSANAGYSFVRWEANGATADIPLWLHENTTINAIFQYDGGGGTVAPVINTIGSKSIGQAQAFSYTPTLQQGDGTITWSLESAPDGMTINSSSGKINWPDPQPADSAHTVTEKALNSAGSDTETFTIYVTAPRYALTVIDGSGSGEYPAGRKISITPTPQTDGIFDYWTGDTQSLTNGVVTMPAKAITLTANFKPAPDLVVTNGTYEAKRYLHGDPLSASVTETNIGTAASTETFEVQLALSSDRVWDNGNDYVVATNHVNGMLQNGGLVENLDCTIPTNSTIPDGFYYLGVMIDATNAVEEIREGNNVWWSSAADVEIHTQPPLEAINRSPVGVNVDRDVTLRWDDGGYASSYRVLFGNSATALRMYPAGAPLTTNYYRIGMREPNSSFWWKVVSINNDGAMTNATAVSFKTKASATFDEATDNSLAWATSETNKPWFSQTAATHDGVDAMQSGDVGDNQVSILQTTVEGPGTNTFWWKVSSESGKDFLDFYVGTNLVDSISGSEGWVQATHAVSFGTQTLTWQYEKDASGSTGSDCGWLDQVEWKPVGTCTVPLSGFEGKDVAVYLWHHESQSWRFLGQRANITQIVVDNIKNGDWYWLCVMEYDGSKWNLAYGSWINRTEAW